MFAGGSEQQQYPHFFKWLNSNAHPDSPASVSGRPHSASRPATAKHHKPSTPAGSSSRPASPQTPGSPTARQRPAYCGHPSSNGSGSRPMSATMTRCSTAPSPKSDRVGRLSSSSGKHQPSSQLQSRPQTALPSSGQTHFTAGLTTVNQHRPASAASSYVDTAPHTAVLHTVDNSRASTLSRPGSSAASSSQHRPHSASRRPCSPNGVHSHTPQHNSTVNTHVSVPAWLVNRPASSCSNDRAMSADIGNPWLAHGRDLPQAWLQPATAAAPLASLRQSLMSAACMNGSTIDAVTHDTAQCAHTATHDNGDDLRNTHDSVSHTNNNKTFNAQLIPHDAQQLWQSIPWPDRTPMSREGLTNLAAGLDMALLRLGVPAELQPPLEALQQALEAQESEACDQLRQWSPQDQVSVCVCLPLRWSGCMGGRGCAGVVMYLLTASSLSQQRFSCSCWGLVGQLLPTPQPLQATA